MAHTDVASNFQRTVKNLLRMKPKPHEEAKASKEEATNEVVAEKAKPVHRKPK